MRSILFLFLLSGLLSCNASTEKTATYQPISVPELQQMMAAHPDWPIIDVRTPEEFAAGSIPGAVNLNIRAADFKTQIAKFPKDQPLIVHCQSGVRSTTACNQMTEWGFKELYELRGGYAAWGDKKK